jgi:serine acetyltransferase
VAAGAVVSESVGDHCLVAGNPARIVAHDYAGYGGFSV